MTLKRQDRNFGASSAQRLRGIGMFACVLILATMAAQSAQAQSLTVLYTFMGGTDGGHPRENALTLDASGNIYGVTSENGNLGCTTSCGNVFKLDPLGNLTTLHTFSGVDGSSPAFSGVVLDSAGNLYGTTASGTGKLSHGVAYKLSPTGQETVLYNFPTKPGDSKLPESGVVLDPAGKIYGTTQQGGGTGCRGYGCGTVFIIDPKTGNKTTVLFNEKVRGPWTLTRSASGVLYGTTFTGGGGGCLVGCGSVFKVDTSGKLSLLYAFKGAPNDGAVPFAPVILDKAGNLYGVTGVGGNSTACGIGTGCGIVYKIDKAGHETVLYTFQGGSDGAQPQGSLALDLAGNLYGTTVSGGVSAHCGGCGTIYKLDKAGNHTVLYNFDNGTDGAGPIGLVRDNAGDLYGATAQGGFTGGTGICQALYGGCGVVFKLAPH